MNRVDTVVGDPFLFKINTYYPNERAKPAPPKGVALVWSARAKSAEKRRGPRPFRLDEGPGGDPICYLPWGWGPWGKWGRDIPKDGSCEQARVDYAYWEALHVSGWDVAPFTCKKCKVGNFYVLQEAPWPPRNGFEKGSSRRKKKYDGWIFIKKYGNVVEQIAVTGDAQRDRFLQAKRYIEQLNVWLRTAAYNIEVVDVGRWDSSTRGLDSRPTTYDLCHDAIWKWVWGREEAYSIDVDMLTQGTWRQVTIEKPKGLHGTVDLLQFVRNLMGEERVVDNATIYSVRQRKEGKAT